MIFGHSAKPWEDTIEEIEFIAGLGMDMIEIVIEPPAALPEMLMSNASKIKAALKENKLVAYGHALHSVSLGSEDVVERAMSVLNIQQSIDASAAIGIEKLVVHATQPMYALMNVRQWETTKRRMIESFSFLHDYGKRNNVQIMVENMSEDPQRFFSFLDEVKGLKMTFDMGHAFIGGGMKFIKKYLEHPDKIEHIHCHDNHGEGDDHLALGKGSIKIPEFCSELKKSGFDKSITLEIFHTPDRKKDVIHSMETIKKHLKI